nr:MAG TPA: adenylation DNA ligase-like protein [Caudoviricetes sp.]
MIRFKPMLAGKADLDNIKFPVMASPKLDGVRVIVYDGVVYSRNFKRIPNDYVQALFGREECDGFDGELIVGDVTSDTVFQATTSGVMTGAGKPDVTLHVFDYTGIIHHFSSRHSELKKRAHKQKHVKVVPHVWIENIEELTAYEEECVAQGYEGIMIRDPKGKYKHGRSTTKEGGLLKIKRFEDDEAVVIGCEELMTNLNEQELDNLGHKVRSSKKEGLVPAGKLGALIVKHKTFGEFKIGSGFTEDTRIKLWRERDELKGRLVKFKYQPSGVKDKPRFPVFLGFRNKIDK